ncbi:GGDEF domain-containing protein [Rhodoferax sp. BAB1]|uniref:GGDEF domain-containing protein n=1 Tax=Rhodoferax sp. BAB1 TaxID=2741720 RepID=UPI001576A223|nr:GGDEF domain-containing protein [Rhodoferax sp. BAB1]QKO22656.1 diguanylate cyclase [Rhodoferax sp. BAB1]
MKHLADFVGMTGHRWLTSLAVLVLLATVGLSGGLVLLAPSGWPTWVAAVLGASLVLGLLLLGRAVMRQTLNSEYERQSLEMGHQCLQEAIEALPLGVAVYDQHDRLVLFNKAATEMAPYRYGGELLGQSFEAIIRRSLQQGAIADALGREEEWLRERLAVRGQLNRPLLRSRPDGRWMHLYEVSTPSGCLVMARLDVTELVQKSMALERSNQQLELLSATDGLTGLANRRQFDQHLYAEWQRSMRSGQPISLLLIDIDHFKRYNDRYGHLAGDACLRQVAGILYDCAQRSGELVARYGGEEFALLLPGADGDVAMTVAQRCMDEIAKARMPHEDSPVSEFLTCSIGVATVVAVQDLVPESLVRCADEALYRVKNGGRGHYIVAPCPA